MKERKYIQKLLDSYMAAETTEEEEQLLSDYFNAHRDIPTEWRDVSIMFRGIRQYEQKPDASRRRTILKWSAAAAITIISGTGMILMQREDRDAELSESVAVEVVRQTDKMQHEPQAEEPTELQEDVCIDCELQTMEDKMLAMLNEFENM